MFQNGILYYILYGFEAVTPTLSALIVIYMFYGKKKVITFLKESYIENFKIMNIILAVLLVFIIGLVTYILCALVSDFSILNTNLSMNKIIVLLWSLIAEELGWRGFLQKELDMKHKKFIPLLVGIIWSLWHYHFFLLGTISVPILLFIISCVIDSYILYFLTKKSQQNIIPASVYHFMENCLFCILLIYPNQQNGNILPYMYYLISSLIVKKGTVLFGNRQEISK